MELGERNNIGVLCGKLELGSK